MVGSTLTQRLELAAVTLGSLVLLQLVWGGARLLWMAPPDAVAPAPSALAVEPLQPAPLPARFSGEEIVSRPLFWEGRQAFAAAEPDPQPAADQTASRASNAIDRVTLLGVFRGDTAGVLIEYEGEQRRLLVDDAVEDWVLTMTSTEGAVFESAGEQRTLILEHAVTGGAKQQRGGEGNAVSRAAIQRDIDRARRAEK